MSILDRITALGIEPGDTIETRQTFRNGSWIEYRLMLLWVGEQLAAWRSWTRHDRRQEWSAPRETGSPDVASYGEWRKVEAEAPPRPVRPTKGAS